MKRKNSFLRIPPKKEFDGKQYTLLKGFLPEDVARNLAASMRQKGMSARVWHKIGELHFFNSYHVYIRDKNKKGAQKK